MCVCVCVCVGVSLRNDFLKNKGAIQAKSPTTRRYTQGLDQINAKGIPIWTKKIKQNTKAFSKPLLWTNPTHYNYEIWKMDVKMTFLNGNQSEDVYMTQQEGFTSKDGSKVCKLQKSIYGLK